MCYGLQSSEIALNSGPKPTIGELNLIENESFETQNGLSIGSKTIKIMEEFVFAINDQEMEINYIEPPFIIATEVRKTDWIKSK